MALEWLRCLFKVTQVVSPQVDIWIQSVKGIGLRRYEWEACQNKKNILGWVKSLFGFFCRMLEKLKWTFWSTQWNGMYID